jgi:hypothetical protein
MDTHTSNAGFFERACVALYNLAYKHAANKALIVAQGGITVLMRGLGVRVHLFRPLCLVWFVGESDSESESESESEKRCLEGQPNQHTMKRFEPTDPSYIDPRLAACMSGLLSCTA